MNNPVRSFLVLSLVLVGARDAFSQEQPQQQRQLRVPVDQVSLPAVDLDALKEKPAAGGGGEVGRLINQWYEAGEAAGNVGDVYYNRDGGHSLLPLKRFPQVRVVRVPRDEFKEPRYWGLCTSLVPHITVGNSSTSSGAERSGSNARTAYTHPGVLVVLALQYINSNLFVYPEHEDYDLGRYGRGGSRGGHGDLFPFNTPYLLISQGSSGSDRAFLSAAFSTLAAFPPETKKKLHEKKLLMPTLQMILRRCQKGVQSDEAYLTGAAHPTVFQGGELDVPAMVKMAHEMTPETTPPLAALRVLEESESRLGVDYFLPGRAERFVASPCFVGRIYRGPRAVYRMVVSAEGSGDVNDRDLTYEWVVLRGREDRIEIRPMNDEKSRVDIRVPYRNGRLPCPDRPAVEHARVDIACFVHNGLHYSPPAIISFFMPPNEYHETVAERGLVEVGRGVIDTSLTPVAGLGNVLGQHHLIRHWDRLFQALLAENPRSERVREWIGEEDRVASLLGAAREFAALDKLRDEAKAERNATRSAWHKARKEEAENADELKKQHEAAERRAEEAATALNNWLKQPQDELGTSPQRLVEETLDALADRPTFFVDHHEEAADLNKRSARRIETWLKQIHNLRLIKEDEEGGTVLNPLRPGEAPVGERLTAYERAGLREVNLRLVNELLGRPLEIPESSPVDRRVVIPTYYRDLYHYTPEGTLRAWTRYHPVKPAQSLTADGKLILERDDAGAPTKTAELRYEAAGQRRHKQKLKISVVE